MKLVKMALKVPSGVSTAPVLPSFTLSEKERNDIKSSLFFQDINIPIKKTNDPEYIKILSESIPLKNGLISNTIPKLTPFEFYKESDLDSSRISISKFPRLSVTRLLTKSWCELREYYKIYSKGGDRVTTERMIAGKELHKKLEDSLHEIIDYSNIDGIELDTQETELITNDKHLMIENNGFMNNAREVALEDTELKFGAEFIVNNIELEPEFKWMFENLLKLRNLLIDGEARELYIFSFFDKLTGEFGTDYDLPVTGIIDYLKLNTNLPHIDDIDELINYPTELSPNSLSISDIKTRSNPSLPNQVSVLDSSKLQVMYYSLFMKNFDTLENSIKLFEHYFKSKKIDIDQPIHLNNILLVFSKYGEIFGNDFQLIRNGEILHDYLIPKYDIKYKNSELGLPFATDWKQTITLKYFILRNAQILTKLSKLINFNDLSIEYYFKNNLFRTVKFNYNKRSILKNNKNITKFWFNNSIPKPIDSQLIDKCKYCEFKNYCEIYTKLT